MSSAINARIKKMRCLAVLERWARETIPRDQWDAKEGRDKMRWFCLTRWSVGDGTAANYTNIVMARLMLARNQKTKEDSIDDGTPLPVEQDEKLSVTEILSEFRKTVPPPPKVDYPIVEE